MNIRTISNEELKVAFSIETSEAIEIPISFVRDALFQAIGKSAWEQGITVKVGDLYYINEEVSDGDKD